MAHAKIKLFRLVRKCCKTMGCIHPSKPNRIMNIRILFFFVPVLLMFLSTTGYIIFTAASILEYAAALYVSTTELAIMVNLAMMHLKFNDVLELIKMLEKLVNKSKFQIGIQNKKNTEKSRKSH